MTTATVFQVSVIGEGPDRSGAHREVHGGYDFWRVPAVGEWIWLDKDWWYVEKVCWSPEAEFQAQLIVRPVVGTK